MNLYSVGRVNNAKKRQPTTRKRSRF